MRVIVGIVFFTMYLLFDVSSLFAQGAWQEGEVRSKQSGNDVVSVEFTGVEEKICVVGLIVGPSAEEGSASFYVFPEGDSDRDRVVIDGKEREIFLKCNGNQISLFVDEKEFI